MTSAGEGLRGGGGGKLKRRLAALAFAGLLSAGSDAQAQTLKEAASAAVAHNPALAARRSAFLAAKERLPQAISGFLPKVSATTDTGVLGQSGEIPSLGVNEPYYRTNPGGYGLQLTQSLFNGFKTYNQVGQAQAQIGAGGAALDDAEQATLFAVANAYVSVMRDRALLAIAQENVACFEREVRLVGGRHDFGDVTATDLAHARSRLAGARLQLEAARAAEQASAALYRATIGVEPQRLASPTLVDALAPPRFEAALALALRNHPTIEAAQKQIEAAERDVLIAQADFLPTASISVSASRRHDVVQRGDRQVSGSVIGQLSIPIFDGGLTPSRVSEARHMVSAREAERDNSRNDVRSAVQVAWSRLAAARSGLVSAESQVAAAKIALSGTVEEYIAGERTTTDVLNSQQEYSAARGGLVSARAERVLASYALARAVGALTLPRLQASRESVVAINADGGVGKDPPPPLRIQSAPEPAADTPLAAATMLEGPLRMDEKSAQARAPAATAREKQAARRPAPARNRTLTGALTRASEVAPE